jgi:opacity protein-like surface antigen
VAQTAYKLSPSAAAPVQTAQAVPPQTPSSQGMQPMADNSSYGGLLYVKAAAGLGVREEANIEGNGQTAAVESDFGWVGNAGLGLDLRNNFRLEGEILYTKNNAKSVTGSLNNTPVNSAEGVGDVSLLGFMGNIAYDFNTAYAITPFIFGGAGIAKVSVNGVGTTGNTISDSDTVFAMQGGAGLSTDLTDRTSFDLSYRYLETLDAKLADSTGVPINYTYQDHMIMLGLHYKL